MDPGIELRAVFSNKLKDQRTWPLRFSSNITFCTISRPHLIKRLYPLTLSIGVSYIAIGMILVSLVTILADDYNKLFGTEDTKSISSGMILASLILTLSGFMLIISLLQDSEPLMKWFLIISTALCLGLFLLSIMKINRGLEVIHKANIAKKVPCTLEKNKLGPACTFGIITMLGSVAHFIGNLSVFVFYNLKYIQPKFFNSQMMSQTI